MPLAPTRDGARGCDTVPSVTTVRWTFAPAFGLLACLALLGGCDGGGRESRLRIEIAAPSGGSGCDVSVAMEPALCSEVEVYATTAGGARVLVPLLRSDADHGDGVVGNAKLRFEGRNLRFDLDTRALGEMPGPFTLEIRVFASLLPAYGATVEGVTFEESEIRVRLYPFREWACPHADGEADPRPRALHAAVPLEDGNVLIFGGVTGQDIDPASVRDRARKGAAHERSVQLYDAKQHRFLTVNATDIDGAAGFGRVLFDTQRLEPQDRDGRRVYRIRVIGGFELPGAEVTLPVVRFDNTGTTAAFGAPVVPAEGAAAGRTVDLIFDPANLSLTVEDAEPSLSVPRGAYIRISDFNGDGAVTDAAVVLIGLGPIGGGMWEPPGQQYFVLRDESAADIQPLAQVRLGATVHAIDDGTFLVWGGNVAHGAVSSDVSAGEIIGRGIDATLVAGGGTRPSSTALHTATRVVGEPGQTRLLLVGGYGIANDGTIFSDSPTLPINYLEVDATGTIEARPVASAGYVNSIFHAATNLRALSGVFVTGGASVESGNRLAPQDQSGYVTAAYQGWDALALGRWGHTMTELSGHRILVVGGFVRDTDSATANALQATGLAEMLYYERAPESLLVGGCTDQMDPIDSGLIEGDAGLPPRLDAGPPDAGPPDAGDVDAGVDAG